MPAVPPEHDALPVALIDWLGRPAFLRAPDGQELFVPLSPILRPYVVPDPAARDRLARRYAWFYLSFLALSVAAGQAAFWGWVMSPGVVPDAATLFLVMTAVAGAWAVAFSLVLWAAVRGPVRGLPRASRRAHWDGVVARTADRTSEGQLLLLAALFAAGAAAGALAVVLAALTYVSLEVAACGTVYAGTSGLLAVWFWQALRHKRAGRPGRRPPA